MLARAIGDASSLVEVGAGEGTLAASIKQVLDAHYVEVEFADAMPTSGDVVLANELLDNLPFRLFEHTRDGWAEVYVDGDHEVLVPTELDADAPVGARIPLQERAAAWVGDALAVAPRVLAIDYTSTTAEMARRPWTEWVRTYREQGPGVHPLERVGEQDITCEVAVDQLPPPMRISTQRDFLIEHGIEELLDDARAAWEARAHVGDLDALKQRARLTEGAALLDPAGLGGFSVLEWRRG